MNKDKDKQKQQMIASKIKDISFTDVQSDFCKLIEIGANAHLASSRCRTGNNVVDFFTFTERLNTKGKYNVSFYEFIEQIDEFKKKKFIQNMLTYYENVKNKNKTKNEYIVYKEVYNICVSAINIFRPIVAMEIYSKYKPTSVLDFCAGWCGRLVGACALNVPKYTGIDINTNLEPCYQTMIDFLKLTPSTTSEMTMYFENAATFDYSTVTYDLVLTSPPYYSLEKYSNNEEYESKQQMNEKFYVPAIENSFKYLQQGGYYCLNVNKEIYENVCIKLLGPANEEIGLKKSKRQNDYGESIYVWHKA